jgi:TPR repeat protein
MRSFKSIFSILAISFISAFAFADAENFASDDMFFRADHAPAACAKDFTSGDFTSAFNTCGAAAKLNDTYAQTALAELYYKGAGVTQNQKLAKVWFTAAAKQGYARAQSNLGLIFASEPVPDYAQAAFWIGKAANQGLAVAQFNLGALYSEGLGVDKDQVKARELFSLAAAQGDKNAVARLAQLGS